MDFLLSPVLIFDNSSAVAQTSGCGSGSSWYLLRIGSPIAANQFRVACNEHDACYDTYGKSKQECDKAFHKRMLGTCARDHNTWVERLLRIACNGRADVYYTGVLEHAQDAYDKAQAAAKPPQSIPSSSSSNAEAARSPVLDADFYIMSYGDLRNAFGTNQGAAKNHWLTSGIKEGRRSSLAFDVGYYLNLYPDLQNAFGASNYSAAVNHWLTFGIKEGRRSSVVFDVGYYLNLYPDLQNAFGASNYSAAVNHWLTFGVSEGRQGSPDFDPKFYLSNNPNVARAYGANNYKGAIEHYLEYGKGEGRRGAP